MMLLASFTTLSAQVKVIAHRGYWTTEGSAQNSIASILKANEIKAYGSEFDVWLSKEGELYVNHDRMFKGIDIYADSYKEIRAVKLKNGEPIPTLKEFLKASKKHTDLRLILEMKSLPTPEEENAAVGKIVKAVKKYKLLERTDFIAFSMHACLAFRTLLPEAHIYYLGSDEIPQKIKGLGLTGIDYSMKSLKAHPEWIEQAHQLGLKVNVWTVNKEKDMRYFIAQGVDFITTNEPELLQRMISEGK